METFPFFSMGGEGCLYLYGDGAGDVAAAALGEIERIEAKYSRYRADSELARINHAARQGGSVALDEETALLLRYAFACHHNSQGLFDVTSGVLRQAWNFSAGQLPEQSEIERLLAYVGLHRVQWDDPVLSFPVAGMELDFGGIGKEYAADRAADVCTAAGVRGGLVDLGGDIRIVGPHPDGSPWRVDIRDPRQPDQGAASFFLAQGAIATSGDYERYMDVAGQRYCHILNPSTGWPAQGMASVSVVAESCLVAGSLASIAMLKGTQAPAWLKRLGCRHLWIAPSGNWGGHPDATASAFAHSGLRVD